MPRVSLLLCLGWVWEAMALEFCHSLVTCQLAPADGSVREDLSHLPRCSLACTCQQVSSGAEESRRKARFWTRDHWQAWKGKALSFIYIYSSLFFSEETTRGTG